MATDAVVGSERSGEGGGGRVSRVVGFFRDVRAELRKVTWPTTDELKKATLVIVIFVSILGIAIGVLDIAFQLVFVKVPAKLF